MSDHVSEDDMESVANRNERTRVANIAPADVSALVANNDLGRDVGAMRDVSVTDSFVMAQRNAEELQKKVDSDAKQISALQEENARLLANEQQLRETRDWYQVHYEKLIDDSQSRNRALRVLSPRLRLIAETVMALPTVHRAMLYESIGVVSREQYDDALSSMSDDYDKDMAQFRQEVDMRNHNTSDIESQLADSQAKVAELTNRLSAMGDSQGSDHSHADTIAKMKVEMEHLRKENADLEAMVQSQRGITPSVTESSRDDDDDVTEEVASEDSGDDVADDDEGGE